MKPRALLTNDDGYDSPSLLALKERLEPYYQITVVAPDQDRSCTSRCVSLGKKITVTEVGPQIFKCSGTPTDCVLWGLAMLFPEQKPSAVFSGVNTRFNLGTDTLYSGTVAAAMEAHTKGIPSVAFSFECWKTLKHLKGLECAVQWWLEEGSQLDCPLLNINIPNEVTSLEPKWCDLGTVVYDTHITQDGGAYILDGIPKLENMGLLNKGTDVDWVRHGYITITQLHHDLTARKVN